ncbi:MAG: ubiquitin-like domain-containing protein [Schwartzia sp. (in: firmicutes)]
MKLHKPTATMLQRRGFLCMLLAVVMILTAGFISVKRITITADGRSREITTTSTRVDRILHEAGIHLDDKDEFRLSTPKLADHTEIRVCRAVLVTLIVDGRERTLKTAKETVGDLMKDLGYSPDVYQATPGIDAPIIKGMELRLRKHADVAAELREAKAAEREATLGAKVIQTPHGPLAYAYVLEMEASAYLPSDGGGAGITASGIPAAHGVVAVDPDIIPLGTKVFVPGYGIAIAADTGGMIEGHMIDLCMEDYGDAINFGRRDIEVYILP